MLCGDPFLLGHHCAFRGDHPFLLENRLVFRGVRDPGPVEGYPPFVLNDRGDYLFVLDHGPFRYTIRGHSVCLIYA